MCKILKFEEFLKESYLDSGKQPIYHFTQNSNLLEILKTDELKTSEASIIIKKYPKNSISFTRSINFHFHNSSIRLVVDADKLSRKYLIYPVDEIGYSKNDVKYFKYKKFIPNNLRFTKQNIYDYDENGLEHEFEERVFKNITDFGKYLIAIQFISLSDIKNNENILEKYLEKYPNIRIELIDENALWKKPVIVKIKDLIYQ